MRKKLLNTIAHLSISYTHLITFCILVLSIFFGYSASQLKIYKGFDSLLSKENPLIKEYNFID